MSERIYLKYLHDNTVLTITSQPFRIVIVSNCGMTYQETSCRMQ